MWYSKRTLTYLGSAMSEPKFSSSSSKYVKVEDSPASDDIDLWDFLAWCELRERTLITIVIVTRSRHPVKEEERWERREWEASAKEEAPLMVVWGEAFFVSVTQGCLTWYRIFPMAFRPERPCDVKVRCEAVGDTDFHTGLLVSQIITPQHKYQKNYY